MDSSRFDFDESSSDMEDIPFSYPEIGKLTLKDVMKSFTYHGPKIIDNINKEKGTFTFMGLNHYDPTAFGSITQPEMNFRNRIPPKIIKKFDRDDIIFGIVYDLVTDLSRDVMSSTLTLFIVKYFELIEQLPNIENYLDITSEITKCLQKHAWKCKNSFSTGGFQTSPNTKSLLHDIKQITDQYF